MAETQRSQTARPAARHPGVFPKHALKGLIDATAWVGTFGVMGDIADALINHDTARPLDVDNRVVAISGLHAARKALQAWHEQGAADYATAGRPLLAAPGGSGYLRYV